MTYNFKTQKAPYPENRENNRSWEATQQEFDFKNLAVFALKLQAHQPQFSFTVLLYWLQIGLPIQRQS